MFFISVPISAFLSTVIDCRIYVWLPKKKIQTGICSRFIIKMARIENQFIQPADVILLGFYFVLEISIPTFFNILPNSRNRKIINFEVSLVNYCFKIFYFFVFDIRLHIERHGFDSCFECREFLSFDVATTLLSHKVFSTVTLTLIMINEKHRNQCENLKLIRTSLKRNIDKTLFSM